MSRILSSILILALGTLLGGCSGGTSGGTSGGDAGGGGSAMLADRFVVSGNIDGTLSLLRVDPVAGFATALAFDRISAFRIRDMVYDSANERLVVIDSQGIHVIGIDADAASLAVLDSATSSTAFNSHLVLSADGANVYVASGNGTTDFIDAYAIDSAGMLTARTPMATSVDPDFIQLNPAGDRLYLVSRSDAAIEIYAVNADGSLAGSPATHNSDQSPVALLFHPDVDVAYLLRADNSGDSLQVLDVNPADGALTANGSDFDVDSAAVDLVISADGLRLYALEAGNDEVHHFDVDGATGALAFVASQNLSFTPTDLQLSQTGAELYVSHSEDDLVSTIAVDPADGGLELMNFTRVFDSANTVAAIGGAGALTPTPGFLLAPDLTGLNRYAIDSDGGLTLADKDTASNALINGEVEVDYINALLFGAGADASGNAGADYVSVYDFDPATAATGFIDDFVGSIDPDSDFQRLEIGRSGRFMYVLDLGNFSSIPVLAGSIYVYAYDDQGDINQVPVDIQATGEGPENLTLSPNGRYLYSINSFDDDIRWYEVSETDGSLGGGGTTQPGGSGPGAGRPIDLVFHPNGRYAYVSIQDESEIGRYQVSDSGSLDNISRFNTETSNGGAGFETEPGPLAMHPGGLFLFAGERNGDTNILVLSINPAASYSLGFEQRLAVTENPSFIEVNPAGDRLYVRYSSDNTIEVFSFDAATGTLASTGQVEDAGDNGGFLPTLTLVAPLR